MADGSSLILILCCFVLGIALKRLRVMPKDAPVALNRFIIYISLPALTLNLVHQLSLNGQVLLPVLMPWLIFAGAVVFFGILARLAGWSAATLGALILTGGLGNTSFVGYPMIEAFYGKEALPIGVLADQPGSFLAVSTVGILAASLCAGSGFDLRVAIRKILFFPPFVAAILAFALRPFPYPEVITKVLDRLGSTLVPLALVSVGMQLTFNREELRREARPLLAGLGYKLILGPALIAFLYFKLLHASGREAEISVFQAAMAPMITGGILATEYDLSPTLASLMIGIGIPLSLVTVPLWWWAMNHF